MRFFIVLLISVLFSCKTTETAVELNSNNPVLFFEIDASQYSGFAEQTQQIITTQVDLNIIWETAHSHLDLSKNAPTIDFNKNVILVVATGQRNSGGYLLKINQIIESEKNYNVDVLETKPGKGCMTTQALTSPYQMVQIEKPNKHILFKSLEKVIDCTSK
jgi:hypothetical protein